MDVAVWLRSLGLEQYEAAFRENAINEKVLPRLTAEDLKDLGVTIVGHRRVLLDAIADLGSAKDSEQAPSEFFATVSPPSKDAAAERRQVTVMFSDLVGSTALSARMDPEDLREVISAYQKCVAETVGRFGGFVAKYMGDGCWFISGIPKRTRTTQSEQCVQGWSWWRLSAQLKTHAPPADPHRHRNGTGGRRRSNRIGRFSGASHRGRDAEPCRAFAGRCGAEQRRDCREHTEARGQPVRA